MKAIESILKDIHELYPEIDIKYIKTCLEVVYSQGKLDQHERMLKLWKIKAK